MAFSTNDGGLLFCECNFIILGILCAGRELRFKKAGVLTFFFFFFFGVCERLGSLWGVVTLKNDIFLRGIVNCDEAPQTQASNMKVQRLVMKN